MLFAFGCFLQAVAGYDEHADSLTQSPTADETFDPLVGRDPMQTQLTWVGPVSTDGPDVTLYGNPSVCGLNNDKGL